MRAAAQADTLQTMRITIELYARPSHIEQATDTIVDALETLATFAEPLSLPIVVNGVECGRIVASET